MGRRMEELAGRRGEVSGAASWAVAHLGEGGRSPGSVESAPRS